MRSEEGPSRQRVLSPGLAVLWALSLTPPACETSPSAAPDGGPSDLGFVLEPSDAGPEPDASAPEPDAGPTSSECQLRDCAVALDVDPSLPEVSFRADLFPTLQRRCSDAFCHGQRVPPFLGPPRPAVPSEAEFEQILAALVDRPSLTAPAMALVTPGDPSRSFLILKVEGCQNASDLSCQPLPGATSGQACGDTMPQASRVVCDRDRALLRAWVAQGARNN